MERVYPDGSSIYYYHGLTRARTPVGARQAATLQHLDETVVLKLEIVKPDGRVVVPRDVLPGVRDQVLSGVEEGDVVEEEYVATVPAAGSSRRGHLSPYVYRFADPERAFGISEYVLLVPETVNLELDGRFEGLEREEWTDHDLRVIRWRATGMSPVPDEPFAPPIQELLPWVTYGFDVTWQDVGDSIRERVLRTLVTSPELDRWAAPLMVGDDPERVLRTVVDALADEVEPGRSALELGLTVGACFSRRSGGRLGILAALLADADWDVDLVLSRPLELASTRLAVPTMEGFFLPLLRVSRDNQTVWVDLGEDRRGVQHVDPVVQGSDGLAIPISSPEEEVSYLESLPSFDNPDLEERMDVRAVVSTEGDARIELEMPLRGTAAERLLSTLRGLPEERGRLVFGRVAAGLFPGAVAVEGEVRDQGELAVLRLGLKLPEACELAGDEMVCRHLVVTRPLAPTLASLPDRSLPLVLHLPHEQTVVLELEPPAGWSATWPERRFDAPWGEVREEMVGREGRALSTLELRIPAQVIEPDDYPGFVRFCHAVDELLTRPPVLVRTTRGTSTEME